MFVEKNNIIQKSVTWWLADMYIFSVQELQNSPPVIALLITFQILPTEVAQDEKKTHTILKISNTPDLKSFKSNEIKLLFYGTLSITSYHNQPTK